jgi:predicted outer membrane repeat protein
MQEALLQAARAFQRSPAFAAVRHRRQTVEHRLARLVQLGLRQARDVGRAKTLCQLLRAATVANLTLLAQGATTGAARVTAALPRVLPRALLPRLAARLARGFAVSTVHVGGGQRRRLRAAYCPAVPLRTAGFRPDFSREFAMVRFDRGLVIVTAAAWRGASAPGAAAATAVDCSQTGLQSAINSAGPGTTLAISGTCGGTFTIAKNLTLAGQHGATLDGKHGGTTVTVSSGAAVTLATLTVTGGSTSGIRNQGALTLDQVTVSGNSSPDDGGGLYNNGTITLQASTLSGNSAASTGGGLFNCCVSTSVPNVIRDSKITGNTAVSGGGIENLLDDLTLWDTTISGNTASGYYGGGLNDNAGTTTLYNSSVTGNTAHLGGGGVEVYSGTVPLNDSRVTGNTPDNCAPPGSVGGC